MFKPTSSPRTQVEAIGICDQMRNPKIRDMTPTKTIIPRPCGTAKAPIIEKMPPTIKNAVNNIVSVRIAGIGFCSINIPIIMEIPYMKRIAELYSNGILFTMEMPEWKSKFKKLVAKIEEQIR